MELTMYEIEQTEHLLAEKARNILNHQHELTTLKSEKKELENSRPTTQDVPLSYKESIEFGKRLEEHKMKMQEVDLKIQKVTRELNALQLQAKKLLPVSEVKVKVSTDGEPCQTYCIEHIKGNGQSHFDEHFEIEPL